MTLVPTNPVATAPIIRVTKMSHLEEAVATLEVELDGERKQRVCR